MATRESSGKVLNALAQNIPWLIGGSADLAKSNKTNLLFEGAGDFFTGEYKGRNIHFGVREHAMGAAVNGMTLTLVRAYSATFFNFSDYMRATYKVAIQHLHGPSTLVFSRQPMPTIDRGKYAPASGVAKGAYVVADADGGKPEVILMGTGTELQHCMAAYEKLKAEGIKARVVSMPCWELYEQQDAAYKESVLPAAVTARVSIEMAATLGWDRYVGPKGKIIGMHSFGASAPLKDLLVKFGFGPEQVVAAAKQLLGK
jgi:transketolase